MKYFLALLICIILIVFVIFILVLNNSNILSKLVGKSFEGGIEVAREDYDERKNKVRKISDITYPSKYEQNKLDIVYPKQNPNGKTIFWTHGGAFVGGDKSDVDKYTTMLASYGYTVINLNYELAPSAKYPAPVIQISDAYNFIKENYKKYKIPLDRVFFGGDSAGAQASAQFINIQCNEKYSKQVNIKPVLNKHTIRGVLLYCGPYEFKAFLESKKFLTRFIFGNIGEAYFGVKDWGDSKEVNDASLSNHITSEYPPVFITDGNENSFEEQGRKFANSLKNNGVEVIDLFYSKNEAILKHEYQFILNTKQGKNTFDKTLEFLEEH